MLVPVTIIIFCYSLKLESGSTFKEFGVTSLETLRKFNRSGNQNLTRVKNKIAQES